MAETAQARVLTYDVENIGIRGWAWGMWEQNILHIDHPQHLLCLAYKWGHEKKVRTIAIWDFPLYKKDPHSDLELAKAFHKVISEADIVIGHNSKSFDDKMVNSMFMRHKLPPPAPYKQVDTKQVAKKYGRFISNKLDDLGTDLGLGNKMKHSGFQLWIDCDNGVSKAHKKMLAYNKQDVILTEQLYLELRPWINNHPPIGIMDGRPASCDNCGSTQMHNHTKKAYAKTGWKMQYKCYNCGAYKLGSKLHKIGETLQ